MVTGSAEAPQLSAPVEPVPVASALRPVCFDGATILLVFTRSRVQSFASPAADGESLTSCPKRQKTD